MTEYLLSQSPGGERYGTNSCRAYGAVSDIRRYRMVMKNGTLFHSSKLYAAVGKLPAESAYVGLF